MRLSESFDLVGRDVMIDKTNAKLYFVDGFCKDEIMVKIIMSFTQATQKDLKQAQCAAESESPRPRRIWR